MLLRFSKNKFAWLALIVLCGFPCAQAHPIPRRTHDRTIAVQIGIDEKSRQLLVRVAYRLEVDEFTVIFDDLPALGEKVELSKLKRAQEIYDTFVKGYAPIL